MDNTASQDPTVDTNDVQVIDTPAVPTPTTDDTPQD